MEHTLLIKQVEALIKDESDLIANLANISALIKMSMPNLNWVGFYIYKDKELVLGPFQGKVACTRLFHGKGVCMHALENNKTTNIANVNDFAGHVVCDSDSKSELVVPLYIESKPFGVLDIDSPIFNRFSLEDELTMSQIGRLIEKKILENK